MASKPPQQPDFESQDFDNDKVNQMDVVIDILDSLLHNVNAYIVEKNKHVQAADAAVESCLQNSLCAVQLMYIRREQHSACTPDFQGWQPDTEPCPCQPDNWLRGALAETVVPQSAQSAFNISQKSVASVNPRRSTEKVKATSSADHTLSRSPTHKSSNGGASTDNSAKHKTRKGHDTEALKGEDRLREELAIRRQQEAIARELNQKDDEARLKLSKLQKDLRGKEYSYNHKGNVVIMNSLHPDALPSQTGVHFLLDVAPAGDGTGQKTNEREQPSTEKHAKTSKEHSKDGKGVPQYVAAAAKTQPSAMETMKIAEGVILRQGNASKSGPARTLQPGQVTRQEYKRLTQQPADRARRVSIAVPNSGKP